jgi:hypothetical protein
MKTTRNYSAVLMTALIFAMILPGCATKKAAWGSLKKGMIMSYIPGQQKTLSYKSTSNFIQEMSVMNQEITVTMDMMQAFKMEPMETENEDLAYMVTLDDMSFKLKTPRGDMEPEVGEIIGKSFELTLSPYGKELEYSGAEKLVIEIATGETKSIASDIAAFFPDLPDHPVKPGDSWKSKDVVRDANDSKETILVFDNINTFEKLESFMGYDCMKINVVFNGTIESEGTQEGMELVTTGEVSGTGTWYFAYKEGIFVSNSVEGTGETETLVMGEGQEITIPADRTFTMTTQLASK